MSQPSKRTRPPLGRCSPTTRRATVDLPQPDSPTRLKVRPRGRRKETWSTAVSSARPPPCSSRSKSGGESSYTFERLPTPSSPGADYYPSPVFRLPSASSRGLKSPTGGPEELRVGQYDVR